MPERIGFWLGKIVRDGVLSDMIVTNQQPEYEELSGERKIAGFVAKVAEEAAELDVSSDTLRAELVQLQSVVNALRLALEMSAPGTSVVTDTLTPASEPVLPILVERIQARATELGEGDSKTIDTLDGLQSAVDALRNAMGIGASDFERDIVSLENKKGGFSRALYVSTIRLLPEDPWVDYYRQKPELFAEFRDIGK